MTIYGVVSPKLNSIGNWIEQTEKLTQKAKHKLKVIDWHRAHDRNISLTARHFGLTRNTVRTWVTRFNEKGTLDLNDRSRRPKHQRVPTTPWKTVNEIVKLRKQYPAWSKYKIQAILKRKNVVVSASTVGRVLKRKGLINERVSRKRQTSALRPKARFPRGYKIASPGDMVQMDTKYIMLIGGRKFYQFTAIDVLTKLRVLHVYASETSRNGSLFLEECLKVFPFRIKAIQTDNGSCFLKEFQKLCEKKGIPHYFTYPRHPQQNTYVEISHGADEREFYKQGNICSLLNEMQKRIKEWQNIWNTFRPHEALNQLTPFEYFHKWQKGQLPTKDVITLQT